MEEQIVAATTAGVGFFTVGYQVLYGVEGLLVDDRGDRNLKSLLPGVVCTDVRGFLRLMGLRRLSGSTC